jgi:nicotianamine synthase
MRARETEVDVVPTTASVTVSVTDLVDELARTDLRPGPRVDALFRALVAAAVAMVPGDVTLDDHVLVNAVQRLCAQGETHLESLWADLVTADPDRLADFPYLDNYEALVAFEYEALTHWLGRRPRSVAVVGSGPLPLTAVLLHRLAPGLRVTCLDRDASALARGRRVASVLGTDGVTHVHADACRHDYSSYDVVMVAALVGSTPAVKLAVLGAVADTSPRTALLAARSVPADGRRLLYPRIDEACMPGTVAVLDEHHPPPGVINSLVLLRPS